MSREKDAQAYYQQSLIKVKETPEPLGQKFHIGERVWISRELPSYMCHFPKGKWAIVQYTYAHAYGGDNVKDYSLDIEGYRSSAWYDEWLLSRDGSDAVIPEKYKHNEETCMLCKTSKEMAKDFMDALYKFI